MNPMPDYSSVAGVPFEVNGQRYVVRRSSAKGDENKYPLVYVLWTWDAHQGRWVGSGTFINAQVQGERESDLAAFHERRARIFARVHAMANGSVIS